MHDDPPSPSAHVRLERYELPKDLPVSGAMDRIFGAESQSVIALLDGNRIPNLPEIFEAQEMICACLFQGDLAEEAASVAPWLVALTRKDALVRHVLTDGEIGPTTLWSAEPGIFIQTNMGVPALKRHLRRFLRVTDPEGRNMLFRFWEPCIAGAYFGNLNDRPALVNRWFQSRDGGQISQILTPDVTRDQPALLCAIPQDLDDTATAPSGAFTLDASDIALFEEIRMTRDMDALAQRLYKTFPDAVAKLPEGTLRTFTQTCIVRMIRLGFQQKAALFTLLAWELHYGPNFEKRDGDGELAQIMMDERSAVERFEMLKTRMDTFG